MFEILIFLLFVIGNRNLTYAENDLMSCMDVFKFGGYTLDICEFRCRCIKNYEISCSEIITSSDCYSHCICTPSSVIPIINTEEQTSYQNKLYQEAKNYLRHISSFNEKHHHNYYYTPYKSISVESDDYLYDESISLESESEESISANSESDESISVESESDESISAESDDSISIEYGDYLYDESISVESDGSIYQNNKNTYE